jgi:DNA-binding MarR family transcriptional regulator
VARTAAPSRTDTAQLATDLTVALSRVVRRLRQAHTPGDLTLSEASVLARLDQETTASPTELALGERVKPQARASTLAALESQGLVSRSPDRADGRRALIGLTPAGRAALSHRRSVKTSLMTRALSDFTADERAQIRQAITLLDRLADRL